MMETRMSIEHLQK